MRCKLGTLRFAQPTWLTLIFDCRACEMHVVGKMKKHILKTPPPVPVTFHKRQPN
ncbi:MAG: hypothetical protein Q8O33_01215 [Pseudomonadota bacterium]|nr:hypothetical protein [Pseudomonadota bacterium]